MTFWEAFAIALGALLLAVVIALPAGALWRRLWGPLHPLSGRERAEPERLGQQGWLAELLVGLGCVLLMAVVFALRLRS